MLRNVNVNMLCYSYYAARQCFTAVNTGSWSHIYFNITYRPPNLSSSIMHSLPEWRECL